MLKEMVVCSEADKEKERGGEWKERNTVCDIRQISSAEPGFFRHLASYQG